jgi:hypothetical protein
MTFTRHSLRRSVLVTTAACLLGTTAPLPALAASTLAPALVTTDEVLDDLRAPVLDRIDALLARGEVRTALVAHGVDAAQVQARVAALTDEEARLLAAELDRLPAGGDVLGYVFLVFIILLITDILGFTKVFPFTRPVR